MNTATSFHIDPNSGNPRSCGKPDNCDWAEPQEHYASLDEARSAFEATMADFTHVRFHKREPRGKHTMELLNPVR